VSLAGAYDAPVLLRRVLPFAAAAAVLLGLGIALGSELSTKNIRETSRSHGTPIVGLRPTGVGLPRVGAHGTIGAGDYAGVLGRYHDSGHYARDLEAVGARAERYFKRRARGLRRRGARRCERARERELNRQRVKRACREPKLAIVFDIDETSLSNYDEMATNGFTNVTATLVLSAAQADAPAIRPTLELYRLALRKDVAVFFITGRPEDIPQARERTRTNLHAAGYEEWEELILKDTDLETIPYKSGKRREIEREGWNIVVNVGDQESDLAGGHADRAFKLPNPFYFIG
jgi:hypothetical protein